MFWGEIIYATPGSGKTHVTSKYEYVIDSDDLIVEAIEEEDSNFQFGSYNDSRDVISLYFKYIRFNRNIINHIYDIVYDKMRWYTSQNYVVLLGTKELMHVADRICIQQNYNIVRYNFKSDKENDKFEELDHYDYNIHYIDDYLDGSLHKICQGHI